MFVEFRCEIELLNSIKKELAYKEEILVNLFKETVLESLKQRFIVPVLLIFLLNFGYSDSE